MSEGRASWTVRLRASRSPSCWPSQLWTSRGWRATQTWYSGTEGLPRLCSGMWSWCARQFGTTDLNHPCFKQVMPSGDWLVGGELELLGRITLYDALDHSLHPLCSNLKHQFCLPKSSDSLQVLLKDPVSCLVRHQVPREVDLSELTRCVFSYK